MSSKEKLSPAKFFLEALMIVLSVLFALFINEWRNDFNENKRTQNIINNIHKEILDNQVFVTSLAKYHGSVRNNITNAFRQDSLEVKFFPEFSFDIMEVAPNGIIQGYLNDVAWEIAKQEQITNRIKFEQSNLLFDVYAQQETVNSTIGQIIDLLSSRNIQRRELLKESVIMLSALINLLNAQEELLLTKYKEALDSFGFEK